MARKDHISVVGSFWFVIIGLLLQLLTTTGVASAQNPVPLVNEPMVPDTKIPGAAGFTLTVNGTGFVSGAKVNWNGSLLATTFVNASRLKASVPASHIAKAGIASVTVVNPSPGGGISNAAFFSVTVPTASIALSAPMEYPTGSRPTSIATADFNGDGKLDLAVSNYGSNNVSVLLGDGDGTFKAALNYDVGTNPTGIAVGDFNRDGKPDLAVLNQNCTNGGPPCGDGTVSVLFGNGDGTFQPPADYAAGSNPNSVTVGDFNGDGKLDLAVANGNSVMASAVSILLGNGDGTFQPPVTYTFGVNNATIATADFTGDGKLDLAVVDNIGAVWILLGNGNGTFQTPASYGTDTLPLGLGIADFSGDGKLDLAVGSSGSNTLQVFLGNGDGTFQSPLTFAGGSFPQGLAVGDFDGSGRLDVAVTDKSAGAVSILPQIPTVSLSTTSLTFADRVIGKSSASQTVTLSSGLPLTISSIAVKGTDTGDFSETNNCGKGLPAGGTCTISIIFMPTQAGPLTASVSITDNAAGSPQLIALSGTGLGLGGNATLSLTSLKFATQLVGTISPAQSVMLTNYGTATLTIASIDLTGADPGDFHQTNTCGSRVSPRASCTIKVTLKPVGQGSRSGTLSITDNAPESPQTIALKGTGTVVELDPNRLLFLVQAGTTATLSTSLTNVGSTQLGITGIKIIGTDTGEFSQKNTCGSSVAAGKACDISVTFKPRGVGAFYAAVAISDDGGGTPQKVSLVGFGCLGIDCKLK